MSVNRYRPHVFVLPEDDANTDLANGFLLHDALDQRQVQVLPCAGGWAKVRQEFKSIHIASMRKYPDQHTVLLVDFDQNSSRFDKMTDVIPPDLTDRVFVVGVWSNPEALQQTGLGTKETIGRKLADECFDETNEIWSHELLDHNAGEFARMTKTLRPILFPQP